MRTYNEMINLLLGVAKSDERIRAVCMNGSRTNRNARKDPFQDYDIVYIVRDVDSFVSDPGWIDCFGERIIMQTPEKMTLIPPESDGTFAYLMLFTDGNRIDLTLCPIERRATWNQGDRLSVVLLDKDEALPPLPAPTDCDYWVQKPNQTLYSDCCNEFWWTSTYVAKGLWRQEILYALDHLNLVRAMLLKMLEWTVGIDNEFRVSVGKHGKYLEQYVDEERWQLFLSTFPSPTYEDMWRALWAMAHLFEELAQEVASCFSLDYRHTDAENVQTYLRHIHALPEDATEIY
ncbi:aminoglycoside 6-adenylyltransferase [Shouchella clausii]|uniref:aminoglycoside 6-adenylyltransferase n=1 Tax=Shouchella clausii TaxID=79880 RepID=UPI003183245C